MTHSLYRPSLGGAPLLTSSFIMWKRCPASGRGRVEQRQTGSGRTFAAINSPPALSSEATRVTREREGRAGPLFTPISNRCFPTPTSKKSLKLPRCCLIFDDWNCLGRCLCRQNRRGCWRDNYSHLATNKIGRQRRQFLVPAFSPAIRNAAAIPPMTIPAPVLFQNEAANLTRSLRCKVEPFPK